MAVGIQRATNEFYRPTSDVPHNAASTAAFKVHRSIEQSRLDSVKQNGRFTDNHLGRSTGMIVGGYSAMVVAPSL